MRVKNFVLVTWQASAHNTGGFRGGNNSWLSFTEQTLYSLITASKYSAFMKLITGEVISRHSLRKTNKQKKGWQWKIHEAEKSNGVNFPLIVSQLAVLRAWDEESASVDERGGGVDEGD